MHFFTLSSTETISNISLQLNKDRKSPSRLHARFWLITKARQKTPANFLNWSSDFANQTGPRLVCALHNGAGRRIEQSTYQACKRLLKSELLRESWHVGCKAEIVRFIWCFIGEKICWRSDHPRRLSPPGVRGTERQHPWWAVCRVRGN